MIGYQWATAKQGDTDLHRTGMTLPAWSLCGVACTTLPKVSAQASGQPCQECMEAEAHKDLHAKLGGLCAECEAAEPTVEDDDPRGDDGPYSYDADSYMRNP